MITIPSMRARRADFDCAVTTLDRVQSWNHLEIDQMAITKSPMPHSQQQFSPAGVNGRLIAVVHEHLRRFRNTGRLMDFETRKRGHAGVFGVRTFAAAAAFGCTARGCAFFSCSAFHTRSGVKGRLRMRTPAA